MGSYKFELNEKKKILSVNLEGFFEKNSADMFIDEYKNTVERLNNSQEYGLYLDCRKMNVIKADLLEQLGELIKKYTEDFKSVEIVKRKDQRTLRIQADKLINKFNIADRIKITEE